jgi:hypothetical protein
MVTTSQVSSAKSLFSKYHQCAHGISTQPSLEATTPSRQPGLLDATMSSALLSPTQHQGPVGFQLRQ